MRGGWKIIAAVGAVVIVRMAMGIRQLLGLNSWTVSRVELKVKEQRVKVWAEHTEGMRWVCPECADELPLNRPWRS
jgi:acid phosphatase family membrane protein YuiD